MILWYKLSFIFGFLITLGIGISVFLYHPRKRTNQYWAFLCLSVATWNFGRFMRLLSATHQDYDAGLFWCRVMYIGAILIPLCFYLFILELLELKSKYKPLAFLSCIFFLSIDFSSLMIKSIKMQFSTLYYPVPGVFYIPFFIYFLSYTAIPHYYLYRLYKTSTGYKKSQIQYVCLASIIGFISGLTTFPLVFNIQFPPVGAPLVSFYTLIISYAIVKYRLLDIHIIIKKTLTYTFLILLLIVPCYYLIMFSMTRFLGVLDPGLWFSILILSIMLFLSFAVTKVRIKTEKTIEQTFFPERYNYLQTLKQISQEMGSIINLPDLLERLTTILHKTFDITKSSMLLFDPQKRFFTVAHSRNLDKLDLENINFHNDAYLFVWLKNNKRILILEELEQSPKKPIYNEIISTLHLLESEVCIPLVFQKRLTGIINLGKKQSGGILTDKELEILHTVANQAAIAIENAQLYKKMLRTDRLAAVGTLAARLAHEIRNPLVSIKTVTELLPERIDDPEFRDHFLNIAIVEVNRIKNLVDDMLNFAKPSTPKFRHENINQLITNMIQLVEAETKSKGVIVEHHLAKDIPNIMVDLDQIKQVFLNILLNAIQACDSEGLVTVITRQIGTKDAQQYVQIEISDTGKGIPEKDFENLFDPFFTTKHEGVGLGLSIAHQIVQEHKGFLELDSKVNEGTTFYINLPMNQANAKDIAV